jgi:cyclohexanone monooxygenase
MQYSFSFDEQLQQEWHWPEYFSPQADLETYANHVADRFRLRELIRFGARVNRLRWDEAASRWHVHTEAGHHVVARYVIAASGALDATNIPDFPGLDSFRGEWHHTSMWPKEKVSFAGKRVGVIGTGSTGIQMIPEIARRAGHVTVFQRTPNFSLPNGDRPLTGEDRDRVKAEYAERRRRNRESALGLPVPMGERSAQEVDSEVRRREFDTRWAAGGGAFLLAYSDLLVDPDSNEIAADYFRERIREKIEDPEVAAKLMPSGYPVGAKRLCLDSDYFETFNRDNVSLVDLRQEPLERVTERGVRTAAGEYDLDVLVLALGFDAVTGALLALDIRGRDGLALGDVWAEGPRSYLGLQVAGFPNLFTLTGPGSPSIVVNVVVAIEQHVEWVAECLRQMITDGIDTIEADETAQAAWVEHVREVAEATLFPRADSFYVGANVPGKPRVFMPYLGGIAAYAAVCEQVVANGYDGFGLTAAAPRTPA